MTTFTDAAAATGEHGRRAPGLLRQAWRIDAALTTTALAMVGVLAVSVLGLATDPRIVTGAPVWLKPAKFAVSISVYVATMLWAFSYLDAWRRTRAVVGWTTALTMVVEMAIIVTQVWRGTSSHFNTSTPLDTTLWSVMGFAIVVQTVVSIALAVALWRTHFADRAMGWAFRLGLTLTILGASAGGLMTSPTTAQLDVMQSGARPMAVGAHTVGAPDGGAGLPGTGWSTAHGDLRVPHFIGLHAFQALPLLALALRRREWSEPRKVRLTLAAAASYALLFAALLAEALRGYSIVRPDGATVAALSAWLVLSAVTFSAAFVTTSRNSLRAR